MTATASHAAPHSHEPESSDRFSHEHLRLASAPNWSSFDEKTSLTFNAELEFEGMNILVAPNATSKLAEVFIPNAHKMPTDEDGRKDFVNALFQTLALDAQSKGYRLQASPHARDEWFHDFRVEDAHPGKKIVLSHVEFSVEKAEKQIQNILPSALADPITKCRADVRAITDDADLRELAQELWKSGAKKPEIRRRLRLAMSKRKALDPKVIETIEAQLLKEAEKSISARERSRAVIKKFDLEENINRKIRPPRKTDPIAHKEAIRFMVVSLNQTEKLELSAKETGQITRDLFAMANHTVDLEPEVAESAFVDKKESNLGKVLIPTAIIGTVGAAVATYAAYKAVGGIWGGAKGTFNLGAEMVKAGAEHVGPLARTVFIETPKGLITGAAKAVATPFQWMATAWQNGKNFWKSPEPPKDKPSAFQKLMRTPGNLLRGLRSYSTAALFAATGFVASLPAAPINYFAEGVLGVQAPFVFEGGHTPEAAAQPAASAEPEKKDHSADHGAHGADHGAGHKDDHKKDHSADHGAHGADHKDDHKKDHGAHAAEKDDKSDAPKEGGHAPAKAPKGGVVNIASGIGGLLKGIFYDGPSKWMGSGEEAGHPAPHATAHAPHAATHTAAAHDAHAPAHSAPHAPAHDSHATHAPAGRILTFLREAFPKIDPNNTPAIIKALLTAGGALLAWRAGNLTDERLDDLGGEIASALDLNTLDYAFTLPLTSTVKRFLGKEDVEPTSLAVRLEQLDDSIMSLQKGKNDTYVGVQQICEKYKEGEIQAHFGRLLSRDSFRRGLSDERGLIAVKTQLTHLLGDLTDKSAAEVRARAYAILNHLNIELTNDTPPQMIRTPLKDKNADKVHTLLAMALYNSRNWLTDEILDQLEEVELPATAHAHATEHHDAHGHDAHHDDHEHAHGDHHEAPHHEPHAAHGSDDAHHGDHHEAPHAEHHDEHTHGDHHEAPHAADSAAHAGHHDETHDDHSHGAHAHAA